MRPLYIVKSGIAVGIFGALSLSAHAEEVSDKSPLSDIYACANIIDNTERLACFDSKVPELKIKEEKKDFVAIDANAVKKIKRDSFGFSMPSLPKLGLPDSKDDRQEEQFEILEVKKERDGFTFMMKNGQVWEQTSSGTGFMPRGDLIATIKPKSFGSYMISASNGKLSSNYVRAKRIK